ncbi:MAG: hypothetical protein HKP25_02225 [Marinicaulis sp.]|nr:hypothetical protein [Marinicaulis sp.]
MTDKFAQIEKAQILDAMQNNYDAHDAFIAAYTSRTGVFISTYLPMLILLGAIPGILLRPDLLEFLNPENAQQYFILILIFGGFLTVAAVESIVGLVRTGAGNPALIIDRNGVRGRHAYRDRIFAWEDIGEIFIKAGKFYVARKPKNFLERITQIYTRPGGRYRFETFMLIPIENIDKSITDINYAIQRYAPDNSHFAEPDWTIPKEPLFYLGRTATDARE